MEDAADQVERVLYAATDPTVVLNGSPVPAVTSLLFRVCDRDQERFDEAVRIVRLFISAALDKEVRA